MIAVCSPVSNFTDDATGACARCGSAIYLRPHTASRVPESGRICVSCFLTIARGGADLSLFVSEETIAELQAIERGEHE